MASSIVSADFIAALRKSWLRRVKATSEEARNCFHVRKTWKSPAHLRNYVSKDYDKYGHDPKPDMRFMGMMGAFKPWAIIGKKRDSDRKKHNGEAQKHNGEAPRHRDSPMPETPDLPLVLPCQCLIPVHSPTLETVPPPACCKALVTEECESSLDCANASSAAGDAPPHLPPVLHLIGVRITARYGDGDVLILPDQEWAITHLQSLINAGWQLTAIQDPGPCFPPDSVDAHFLIPGGQVRAFEIAAAPAGGFARIVRYAAPPWTTTAA